MNNLVLRGLNNSATYLILRGLGEFAAAVSGVPGSYRLTRAHPIFKILQRGLEVKQLYWRTEEINPMVVLVSIRKDERSIPIKVATLNSANIKAKVPIAMLATKELDVNIIAVHPVAEYILNPVNIYKEVDWSISKPSAIFSLSKEFEVKPFDNLKITKSKELELTRK